MTTVSKSALVPYSSQQMFDLAADVESYPEFLPWCGGATVLSRDGIEVVAEVVIDVKGMRKSFSTINQLVSPDRIDMKLLKGPFSSLSGGWSFHSLKEDACKVSLDLEFGFSNKLLSMTLGPIFSQIADTLVDAFCKRADSLYKS